MAVSQACRCAHARVGEPCRNAAVHVTGRCCTISQLVLLPLLRHKGRPQPRYKFCITTPPLARPHALASALPCAQADHVVHVAGRIMAVLGRVAPPSWCAQACFPAQPVVCHYTVEPVVCLLSLLRGTIQPSLLCACSACCLPQYS